MLLVILIGPGASAQIMNNIDRAQMYQVGYRVVITVDSGRTYKPAVPVTDKFHFRPVEIDMWYPAIVSKIQRPMLYGAFLNLLEQRSNRFQNDTVYKNLTTQLVQYLGVNLHITDSVLERIKTSSYLDAENIKEPFPLILYMSSFNGISYENLGLFQYLASRGYIVVCVTSVGRYPGNMSTKIADVMEQVNDGYFILNYLKKTILIDSTKIGSIGYSWGGLADVLLSMKTPDIKALLSLDGSEIHYYGESQEEDMDFDDVRRSRFFHTNEVRIPYAYLESGNKQNDREVDSIFNILNLITSKKYYIHLPHAVHENFSFLYSLNPGNSIIKSDSADLYNEVEKFSLNYFDAYLKNKSYALALQLNTIYGRLGDSIYPRVNIDKKIGIKIKGEVLDLKNNEALAYVNIGIRNKNVGTVTQKDGSFQFDIPSIYSADSLTISIAGYNNETIAIYRLIHESGSNIIFLKQRYAELNDVVIIKKSLPVKILGNTTTSNFVSVGLPLKFLGSEVGVKINLGKKPVMLKKFSFNVSGNRLDTAVFRMNIYDIRNGIPYENVLQNNILIRLGKQTGLYSVDLTPYKMKMNGEILLSLEWIGGSSATVGNGAIFLSAGFLNSSTWHRITSQGEWKKAPGLGVGLNIEVQKLSGQ